MTRKFGILITVKVFIVLSNVLTCYGQEGDQCTLRITRQSGICRLSQDCKEAQELQDRGISPTICGYSGLTPIVCCERKPVIPNDGSLDGILFPEETSLNEDNPVINTAPRKSEKKCADYSKAVVDQVHALPLVTGYEPISINVTKCEFNSVSLIVGGSPAAAGEFPFMVAVGFIVGESIDFKCGGTLISEKWVLTAAHCSYLSGGEIPQILRMGELDMSRSDESEHFDYDIDQIIVHPGYDHPKKYNDIALMSTKTKIKFTKYIRPACLFVKSTIPQHTGIATGWGKLEYTGENSNNLMKVALNIYANRECQRVYQSDHKSVPHGVDNTMLCAGELKGGRDTCLGDSGGPLLLTDEDNQCKFYIIGVTSFGKGCAEKNTPAIYTRVSEYVSWIEEKVW